MVYRCICKDVILGICLLLAVLPAVAKERAYGWVEKVYIPAVGVTTKVKLDTGALTSSIHVTDVERFNRGKEKWVRFTASLKDTSSGEQVTKTLERRFVRRVKLTGAGGEDHRLVVYMDLCIGDQFLHEQVTLSNRADKNYDLLIGRRTIARLGFIDVRRTFTVQPLCHLPAPAARHGSHP